MYSEKKKLDLLYYSLKLLGSYTFFLDVKIKWTKLIYKYRSEAWTLKVKKKDSFNEFPFSMSIYDVFQFFFFNFQKIKKGKNVLAGEVFAKLLRPNRCYYQSKQSFN